MRPRNPDSLLALMSDGPGNTGDPDEIGVVSQARRSLEAVRLICLGARATLVCQLTGLPKRTVCELYPHLTGSPSPSGQVPFTDTWYLKNNRRMLHANVVWQLYQHFGFVGHDDPGLLIHVYQTYLQITEEPVLTLTRAYFVPRLLSIHAWCEQSCIPCGLKYVGPPDENLATCPACVEYFRHRCRGCGAIIKNRPLGRPKSRCTSCLEQRKKSVKRAEQVTYVEPEI